MLQRGRWATALSCRCNVLPVHWTGGVASPAGGHRRPRPVGSRHRAEVAPLASWEKGNSLPDKQD